MGCNICTSKEEIRHINLYIIGSEGVYLCYGCEMVVVKFIRSLQQISTKATIESHKRIKKNFKLYKKE